MLVKVFFNTANIHPNGWLRGKMSEDNTLLMICLTFGVVMSALLLLFFVEIPINNKEVAIAFFQSLGSISSNIIK